MPFLKIILLSQATDTIRKKYRILQDAQYPGIPSSDLKVKRELSAVLSQGSLLI
jgi:hypothetical protein